jgi:hypothetical protein
VTNLRAADLALTLMVAATALVGVGCGSTSSIVPPTPVLAVTAISPSRGASVGTTEVTLTGTAFGAGMTVTIGGVAASNIRVQSSTTALAIAGPHDVGQYDVAVSLGGRTATLPAAFAYAAPGPGALPTITGFTARGSRSNEPANFADIGEIIAVTASVQSTEPLDRLTFEWTADAGTFTGTGPSVAWAAPQQVSAPTDVRLTLRISKSIDVALPYPTASTVSVSGSTTIRVHNSTKEISDLSVRFLEDFSNSTLSAAYVVRDFYDGCPGKASELGDVQNNRNLFNIFDHRISSPSLAVVDFGGVCTRDWRPRYGDGCVAVPVYWHSLRFSNGQTETTIGIDYLSAVYRSSRWWLCDSDFGNYTVTNPLLPPFIR